ncbi:MAG: 50S ribosomal protein L22 [Alphaproteobacteria bacterium]|nr:50S ribosomal protein L22 [Alphaproteobacteria bacterium]NDC55872.1 50S ribosomal protein L22 [Alphaproteobacteria bacterium]NDG03755.1 50S ribosomal protein L22 [Alphaproteobacteria bacterium]
MSKPKSPRKVAENEALALGKTIRVSPQKLNLVAETIRGRKAANALTVLEFNQRRIAKEVKKVLQSAIANAENNHGLDIDQLVVSEASVGKALVMGRFHARGRGKSSAIEKPFSNLRIVVRQVDTSKKAAKKGGKKSTEAAAQAAAGGA